HVGTRRAPTAEPFEEYPDRVDVSACGEACLLGVLASYFPHIAPRVVARMAGLRVLPTGDNSPFQRSREVRFVERFSGGGGYLAILGGKLTGYRATALKVMARLETVLGRRPPRADTARLMLPEVGPSPRGW